MKKYSLMHKLADRMELPAENIPLQTLVEVCGYRRVLIENHRGVIGYSRDTIRIRVNYGEIEVSGSCLELNHMSREVMVITGNILCVSLHREVGKC